MPVFMIMIPVIAHISCSFVTLAILCFVCFVILKFFI